MAKTNLLPEKGRGSCFYSYQGKGIDQMIYEFMSKENIPGMTLAIVQAPYIPRVVGYGLSDVQRQLLASPKTLWSIGPISQGFTAVAIMQLFEEEKIDLKDPISKYLLNLADSWKNITIKQLLQHATGIADYRLQKGYDSTKSYSFNDLIQTVINLPLAFKPGTNIQQSATNFLILTEIIEKVSQIPYHDFITKNQIVPLGLKRTCFAEDLNKFKQEELTEKNTKHKMFLKDKSYIDPTEYAAGYDQELNLRKLNPSSALKGFGDIWASAEDVSFWDMGLAGDLLIKKSENRDLIYKPTTLDNGKLMPSMAGWQFQFHKGLLDIKGTIPGFSSFLSRFTAPSELVCVTLLANREGLDLTHLGRQIASAFDEQLSSGVNEQELYVYESIFSVKETASRLEEELKKLNIPIFAKFDHTQNAKEVNLEMLPTVVIVFGSPAVGTKLMQDNPSVSIELPLKISVWEDAQKRVWVTFPQMHQLGLKYKNLDKTIIEKMQSLLERLVIKSANIY